MFAAFVIERTFTGYVVRRIGLKIPFFRVDFEHDYRAAVSAARRVRFADFFLCFAVFYLSGYRVFNFDIDRFRAAEKPRVNHIDFVYRTIVLFVENRDRRLFFFGVNLYVRIRHFVKVGTERNYIFVIVILTENSRFCGGRFEFVLLGNGSVLFAFRDIVNTVIEQRRVVPVAVESKIRKPYRYFRFSRAGKRHETFDVHSVFEILVEFCLGCGGERYFYVYFNRSVCGDYNVFSASEFSAADGYFDNAVVEHIGFLRDRPVIGCESFRHNENLGRINLFLARHVVHGEIEFVNAGLFLIVVKFYFRFIAFVAVFILNGDVTFGFDSVFDTGKPRALFSRRIGVVFLVSGDSRGTHKHLIDSRRKSLAF